MSLIRLLYLVTILLSANLTFAQPTVVLELFEEHSGLVGDVDLTDYNTYRVFVQFENIQDDPFIFFGSSSAPLSINTNTSFFQSQFGGVTAESQNPVLIDIIPSILFDTYLTIASDQYWEASNQGLQPLEIGDDLWIDAFEEGDNLLITGEYGGAWWAYPTGITQQEEGKILVAQLTTDGHFWGTLNFEYRTNLGPDSETVIGLQFGSEDELIIGCTDENALNYDPLAFVNYACEYLEGDLNQDGIVNIDDILDFLNQMGCMEDCGGADFNGDGIVNIWDLLMLLGFFG
jgi:hypothetical protein